MANTKKAPIAPNDPERPDYPILGSLLGREIPVPEDMGEAKKVLKSALEEVYTTKPHKLIVTCATSRRCNAKKALAQFTDDSSSNGLNQEVLSFVTARLWNRNPSGRESVHRDVDKSNPSSNGIRYWDPEKCGVVPWINARVGLVMKDYWKEKALESPDVSLDGLAEKGLELSNDQVFVRQQRSADHEIDLDRSTGEDPSELKLDEGKRQFLADSSEINDNEGYGEEFHADEKEIVSFLHQDEDDSAIAALSERSKKLACQDPKSPNRSDLTYLLNLSHFKEKGDLKISEKPEIRNVQIKSMALRALQEYAGDHEEFEDVYSIVEEDWNPDESVLEVFAADAVDLIDEGVKLYQEQKLNDSLADSGQLEMFGAVHVDNDSEIARDPRYGYMTQDQVLKDDELQARLWRTHDDEDLASPERSDYQYLCYRFKKIPSESIDPSQLYEDLHSMGIEYVKESLPTDMLHLKPAQQNLIEDMIDWNPANSTFQGCIQNSIGKMMEQGRIEELENARDVEEEKFAVACRVEAEAFDQAQRSSLLFESEDLEELPPEPQKVSSIKI